MPPLLERFGCLRLDEDIFNRIENTLTESIEKLKKEPKINESVKKIKRNL